MGTIATVFTTTLFVFTAYPVDMHLVLYIDPGQETKAACTWLLPGYKEWTMEVVVGKWEHDGAVTYPQTPGEKIPVEEFCGVRD